MSRRGHVPTQERVSQMSFVQSDSDDDNRRLPILPSYSKSKKPKQLRRKSGISIPSGLAIQSISSFDKASESKPMPRAYIRKSHDSTPATSYKRKPATKHVPRKSNHASSYNTWSKNASRKPSHTFSNNTLPLTKQSSKNIRHASSSQPAGKQRPNDSPRPESCIPTQDMEVPYAQNLGIEGDENLVMACALSDDRKEPLNPGDVIHYYHPAFVAGSELSIRVTQVVATNPTKADFPLELDNGELIPRDTRIRRLKEYENGKLYNHPGIFRDLETFRMKKRSLSSTERKMLPGARQKTIDLLNDLLKKTNESLEKLPSEMMSMKSPNPGKHNIRMESDDSDSSSDSDSSLENLPRKQNVQKAVNDSDSSSDSDLSQENLPRIQIPHKTINDSDSSSDSDSSQESLPGKQTSYRTINDLDSSSDSDPFQKSLPGKQTSHRTVGMTSRFSIETQQNRKLLSPRNDDHGVKTSQKDMSNHLTLSKSPKSLVLKNLRGFKAGGQTTNPSQKVNGKDVGTSMSLKRKEFTTFEKVKDPQSCTGKATMMHESKGRASSGSSPVVSSNGIQPGGTPIDLHRTDTKKQDVHELASSESDDDFDEALKRPVFSSGQSKQKRDILGKSKSGLDMTDTTKLSAKLNDFDEVLKRPVFSSGQGKRKRDILGKSKSGLGVADAIKLTAKLNAKSNSPKKETSRWSTGSDKNEDKTGDSLWESSESDIDSTRISVTKKRRINKTDHNQSALLNQEEVSVPLRRRKIKGSTFQPSGLEEESSYTLSNEDITSEKAIWNDYQPKFLKKQNLERESLDDIDGFSSQETRGNKSRTWGGLRLKGRGSTLSSSSTLKLKPVPLSVRQDRF